MSCFVVLHGASLCARDVLRCAALCFVGFVARSFAREACQAAMRFGGSRDGGR
ncbi:hypothetical protein BMAGB8_3403, partial [Burkholderia mallei GB8 horse 4]